MSVIFLLMLVLLAVGAALIWRGLVGAPEFTGPVCAKCGYDVRTIILGRAGDAPMACPECGNDLATRRGIAFGRRARRPGLVVAGAVLAAPMLLVTAGGVAQALLGINWQDLKPTGWLIADARADSPRAWRPLQDRLSRGRLTPDETQRAVEQLIAVVRADRARGGSGPLHWADDFLGLALAKGHVPDEQLQRLCDAFYGRPTVSGDSRVRTGRPLELRVAAGQTWDLPSLRFIKALREARTASGETLRLWDDVQRQERPAAEYLSRDGKWDIEAIVPDGLPPGEHVLTFTVDMGVLPDASPMAGPDGRPGQRPRWVNPRLVWTETVEHTVTVLPKDAVMVTLVTDPAMDPRKLGHLRAPRLVLTLGRRKPQLALDWPDHGNDAVPVAFDLFWRIDGKETKLGSYARAGGRQRSTSNTDIDPLPPAVSAVDLILRPSTELAEELPDVTEIWGEEIVFEGVPLERFDLPVESAEP